MESDTMQFIFQISNCSRDVVKMPNTAEIPIKLHVTLTSLLCYYKLDIETKVIYT